MFHVITEKGKGFSYAEEVEQEIDKVGDLHLSLQRWSIKKDILKKKYKINWRTPKEMNPRVMFD